MDDTEREQALIETRRIKEKERSLKVRMRQMQHTFDSVAFPFVPTEAMQKFAALFIQGNYGREKPSKKYLADQLNIHPNEITKWFQNPRFLLWLDGIRRAHYSYWAPAIDKKLIEKALSGSVRHMKLFYTLRGDLEETAEQKAMRLEQFDAMSISQQYVEFSKRIAMIRGKMGVPVAVPEMNSDSEKQIREEEEYYGS